MTLQEQLDQASREYRGVLIRVKSQCEAEGNRAMTATELAGIDEKARALEAIRKRVNGAQGEANFTAALTQATAGMVATTDHGRTNGGGGFRFWF